MRIVSAVILLMIAFGLVACDGNGVSNGNTSLSSTKAITAFSFTNPAATCIINDGAKTISVNVPYGTNVTALVATYTTTGASVKIGSSVQTSGTTPNDFTNSIGYIVTAADGTTALYTASVTVSPPAGGTLDMSFGIDGKVTTAFGSNFGGAYAAAIQTDGKIVAVGYTGLSPSPNCANCSSTGNMSAIARYNADGSLDTNFGDGGKVVTAFGSIDDRALAVANQTDGKIVAVGYSNTGTAKVFALARYNTDGTLDASFGTGGKVTTAIGSIDDHALAVAIQTDGKIVTAGYSNTGIADIFALARYNTDGTLDMSFGTGGKVTTTYGTFRDRIEAIRIQTDGKIVAAGHSWDGTVSVFALARYNSNGTLDASFGSGGKVTTVLGTSDSYAYAIAVQTDGKIITSGWSWVGTAGTGNVFALARYNSNGTLDTNFGTGGTTTTAFGASDSQAFDVAIQADGKLVTVGWSIIGNTSGFTYVFALARYNNDGTLDTGFGTGGQLTTAFGTSVDYATDVAIQSDGKIVTVGLSWTSTTSASFAIARYWP